MAEANDFTFGIGLEFAKSNYKITPKDKSVRFHRLGSSQKFRGSFLIFMQWLKVAILNLAHSLGSPILRIMKSHK